MNRIMKEHWGLFEYYQALRGQLMNILQDEELSFRLGGQTETLGDLCFEIGEVQHSYVQSFQTFTQNFDYRHHAPGLSTSVSGLKDWYAELDEQLKTTIERFSDDDLQRKTIDRGQGFKVTIRVQLEIYKEALLIFYGKCSVYLKAMEKDRPEQWQEWIG